MTAPDALDLFQFHTPAVRHLAWLCHAPQLIQHTSIFEPARYLPDNYLVILQEWDKTPSAGPEGLFCVAIKTVSRAAAMLGVEPISNFRGQNLANSISGHIVTRLDIGSLVYRLNIVWLM